MLRQGPIPRAVHGLIEYVAGGLTIAAPFILSFDSGAATALAIVIGVLMIVLAATSSGPSSLVNQITVSVHVALDYALAAALIASPFLFGFSDEGAPTAYFLIVGVLHLLMTIGTRFLKEGEPRRERGRAQPG